MTNKDYEHLVKSLSVANRNMSGGGATIFQKSGNADKLVWLNGRDHLEGMELNFSWGFYSRLGDWHPNMDPHVHPYPECLVFVGHDPNNLEYLGAEIEICMGEELEVHTFDKPTCVIAPAGFIHCPVTTKNVTDPSGFSFFIISLGAIPTTTWMGEGFNIEEMNMMQEDSAKTGARKPAMISSVSKKRINIDEKNKTHGHKYDHLVLPLTLEKYGVQARMNRMPAAEKAKMAEAQKNGTAMKPGPGNADSLVWLYSDDLKGMELNFTWGFYSKPGIWHRNVEAHVHPESEVLVFVGLDKDDIDYLGAEIEIDLGKEHER